MSHLPRFESARFAISVAEPEALERADLALLPELAFAGRSNAGKSTAINRLVQQRRLAYASKTPGRTQMLNFFAVRDDAPGAQCADCAYLVDLPGYGFARAAGATRATWDALAGGYLLARRMLRGVVLVMDARRPCLPADRELIAWLCRRPDLKRLRLHLLLSKSDQLARAQRSVARAQAEQLARELPIATSVQLFSALDLLGVEELRATATQILLGTALQVEDAARAGAAMRAAMPGKMAP